MYLRNRISKHTIRLYFRWSTVNKANAQENPLGVLPSFNSFKKDDVHLVLETKRSSKKLIFGLVIHDIYRAGWRLWIRKRKTGFTHYWRRTWKITIFSQIGVGMKRIRKQNCMRILLGTWSLGKRILESQLPIHTSGKIACVRHLRC